MHYTHIRNASRAGCAGVPLPEDQRGFTLVELLVAMAISSVIVIAAISALIVSRQGFTTVDAASQLRDNARFATDLIQRLGVQAGFQDVKYSAINRSSTTAGLAAIAPQNVSGVTNAIPSYDDPFNTFATRTNTNSIGYGSDVLILRYQTVETYPDSGVSDQTIIDCAGSAPAAIPVDQDDRLTSVLYVDDSQGEPSLMCSTGPATAQPIVRGIENFQVLYGVSGVTPNTAPAGTPSFIPDRYLRADQMTVAGSASDTTANWSRVRSIRIGMVLRGPPGSAQESIARTYYPFGRAPASSGGAEGSAMSSANDPGTVFSPSADTRLRQTVTFTVHLRNNIGR